MRKSEEYIRQAMDKRLSVLDDSPECRARIRRKIMQEEEKMNERQTMRRLPVRAALVLAAVLLLGSIAMAAVVNVFDVYGTENERVGGIAAQTVLEDSEAVTIEDQDIGTSTAVITNGYYDGTALMLGYAIENAGCVKPYTPSEEELSAATVRYDVASPYFFHGEAYFVREEERALMKEFAEAIEQGRAFGVVVSSIDVDDWYCGDSVIGGRLTYDYFATSSEHYALELVEAQLIETTQQLEALPVKAELRKQTMKMYFDGENFYVDSIEESLSEAVMTAVIPRTEVQIVRYEGAGEYRGMKVHAALELSPVTGELTIKAEEGTLKGTVSELKVELMDAQGNRLQCDGWRYIDAQTCVIRWNGNLTQPDQMRVRIYEEVEYGEYEMVPYAAATERWETVYETEIDLVPAK